MYKTAGFYGTDCLCTWSRVEAGRDLKKILRNILILCVAFFARPQDLFVARKIEFFFPNVLKLATSFFRMLQKICRSIVWKIKMGK